MRPANLQTTMSWPAHVAFPCGGQPRRPLRGRRSSERPLHGTPRSVAFDVQGFEVAVHRRYGEIRILEASTPPTPAS